MKFLIFALSILILLYSGRIEAAEKLPAPFKIIPQPQQVELINGLSFRPENLKVLVLSSGANRPVLGQLLSRLPIGKLSSKGSLSLTLDTTLSAVQSPEGYVLTILSDKVSIVARGEAGLFYGCQSLEQLLEDAADSGKPVPCCKITDFPALVYRAVHFDVKHHLDHMNYYYESIDRLSRYKINAVVFEFEDKLRYQRQPLVGAPQAISIDEMAALTRYARERHIEITPLVQGLGHATFILKHQEYAYLREIPWNKWAFCPLNEGTYQVLFDLYRDAIAATPGSKYLHIGGDEIGNIGLCPRCKPTADKEGVSSLGLYWLKRVCEFAQENGRIPIFWDDMPLKEAGVFETTYDDSISAPVADERWKANSSKLDEPIQGFPKNCVYMRWNYSMARQPGNILALDWYKKHSLKAMAATATNGDTGMLFQSEERNKGAASSGIITIQSFAELAGEKDCEGLLCTAWDDASPHIENFFRGFIAAAEYCWSPKGRSLDEFDTAWLQKEFGVSMPDYMDFVSQLRKGSELMYSAFYRKGTWMDSENELLALPRVEHWLKPVEGMENRKLDYGSILIDLPDPNSPGSWSAKYKDRLEKSRIEMGKYSSLLEELEDLQNRSKRNRYYWQLSIALHDLQVTAPQMLLALKQSDTADAKLRQKGIEAVRQALRNYDQAWTNLKQTYAETRFISYPVNYVPDRYFHLASQREDLSWMVQADEKIHEQIIDWLQAE